MGKDSEKKSIYDAKSNNYDEESYLTLLSIYLTEWTHQDGVLWNHVFAYFVFSFAVIVFPVVCPWNMDPCIIEILPLRLFPIVGIVLAFALLFVMLGYKARMECSAGKYRDLIRSLDEDVRESELRPKEDSKRCPLDEKDKMRCPFYIKYKARKTLKEKWRYILGTNLTRFIAIIMFVILVSSAFVVLHYIPQIKEALTCK